MVPDIYFTDKWFTDKMVHDENIIVSVEVRFMKVSCSANGRSLEGKLMV